MLYLAVIWSLLFCICLIVGCGMLHWLRVTSVALASDRAIIAVWLGLVLLAISALAVAIVVPLSPLVGAIVTGVWLGCALSQRSVRAEMGDWWRRITPAVVGGYVVVVVAIALYINHPTTLPDAGLYHYGMIRWFAEYGVTPGLVLLNRQLGFVSAWFAITAPLLPLAWLGYGGNVMNGLALLLAAFQMAIALNRIRRHRAALRDWFLLIFTLSVCGLFTQTFFLSTITRSPSPDLVIVLLTVVAVWAILAIYRVSIRDETVGTALILPILAAGALSFKLTALPLMLIVAGFYLCYSFSWQRLTIGVLSMAVLLFPFFTTQILVSGCPLYPSTLGCLALPWTLSETITTQLANQTHGWATWFGEPDGGANRTLWLLQQWFNSNHSSKLIAVLVVLSLISAVHLLKTSAIRRRYILVYFLVLAVMGTSFMLLKAPLLRFCMAYILMLPALSAAIICRRMTRRFIWLVHRVRKIGCLGGYRGTSAASISFLAFVTVLVVLTSAQPRRAFDFRVGWLPPPLPTPEVQVQTVNRIAYVVIQDSKGKCWAEDLPCVDKIRPSIRLRRPELGIAGGFRR